MRRNSQADRRGDTTLVLVENTTGSTENAVSSANGPLIMGQVPQRITDPGNPVVPEDRIWISGFRFLRSAVIPPVTLCTYSMCTPSGSFPSGQIRGLPSQPQNVIIRLSVRLLPLYLLID